MVRGAVYRIKATVKNISKDDIQLFTSSCGYGLDWVINGENIRLKYWNCKKNVPQVIILKPGEVFGQSLEIEPFVPLKDIRFRLGYNAQKPVSEFKGELFKGSPFWSQQMSLVDMPCPARKK